MKTETLITALGRDPERDSRSVNPPVHHTSTLLFSSLRELLDYEAGKTDHPGYARHGTPTIHALEGAIAELEGGDYCHVTASGQSATVLALMTALNAGDHVLVTDSIYSTTRQFVIHQLSRFGVEYTFYDPNLSAEEIEPLFKPNTRALYVESPGSLTFEVQDVPALAKLAHSRDALIISDSTWATPLLQRPFDLGIDLSIQSCTKYIAGHSDLMMGSVTCKEQLRAALKKTHHHFAMIPGPDNVYLALRGLRTISVRLKQHEQSALAVAKHLQQRPEVERVLHPALPEHPGHKLWKRDLTGSCGLFGVVLKDVGEEQVIMLVDALKHFGIGYSWGGFESLAIAYQPAKLRSASQWGSNTWMMRLNIGLEHVDDLIADLDQAFAAMSSANASLSEAAS